MSGQTSPLPGLIIPPRGRAVLCAWAAVPGLIAAPFIFWQNLWAGAAFCGAWTLVVLGVRIRASSFVAVLGRHSLSIYAGVAFPMERRIPRSAITGVQQLRTPLLRMAGATVIIVSAPGARLWLPAVQAQQAEALAAALRQEDEA
ncbi:MAG: hypothetical protein ACI4JC_01930 [Faecalibacterium sp.]